MAEFEDRTRRDPGTTSADRGGGTRRDAGVPRPRGLVRLPDVLAGRFRLLGELPVQGAESDLLHVADERGEYVVKLFRQGYRADEDVWRALPGLTSEHVVRVLETGHAEGRDFEVTEYLPAGNLRGLMASAAPYDLIAAITGQLADGLETLHRAGIVHRDLKPENVLIAGTAPLWVVIADFGLSRVIDESVVFASASRTLAYAAPESLSGQISPARDWWSLGMIVRELATGRPPFGGMSETVVVDHLATRPVDNDDVADERLRLLCQGLLTRDPRRRWGAREVAAWLDGRTPEVAKEQSAPPAGPGLLFDGRRHTGRRELAAALVADWPKAARYLFGRGDGSEAMRGLRGWLGALGDDTWIELYDAYLTGDGPPDVKLLHLVRWLDPDLPPHYLGRRVTAADLPGLAGLAADTGHPDHDLACRIGLDLWRFRLLPELDGGDLDAGWRSRAAAWDALVVGLRPHLPGPAAARLPEAGGPQDRPPAVLLGLLALAADPERSARALGSAAARARAAVRGNVDWFAWLADGAGDDPLRHLTVVQTAPEAVAEVAAADRSERARLAAEQGRRDRWAELERARLAGSGAATSKALLWSLPVLAVWLAGSWLVDGLFGHRSATVSAGTSQGAKPLPFAVLVVVALLAWGIELGCEVALARRQGGAYLPYGPWAWLSRALGVSGRGLSAASRAVSGSARRGGPRGCGFLLLATVLPLLLILLVFSVLSVLAEPLWMLVMLATAAVHAVLAGVRLHRWRQEHAKEAV